MTCGENFPTTRGARVVGRRCSKVEHIAQNSNDVKTRRNLTLFNEILMTGVILAGAVGSFGVACKVVKDWNGCSDEEAAQKIRDFVNGKVTVPLSQDQGLQSELCQGLQSILGDKRYNNLARVDAALRAAGHTPVIASGTNSGLPCIDITVQPKDDTEKQTIEVIMIGIIRKHLVSRGLGPEVLGDWKKRLDINYPYLEIRYPEDAKDRKLVIDTIIRDGSAVVVVDNPLTDDTEEEDLTDDTEEDN